MILRDYQTDLVTAVELQWALDHRNVLARLDTGGGKSAILGRIIDDHAGFSCAIAHRDRLIEQLSLTLARGGIRHDLICSEKSKRIITRKHIKKLGQCYYVPGARCRIASMQTLVKAKNLEKWESQVTLWIVDEAHHLLRANGWGKCIDRFTHPQCKGLLLTATPGRPDGKGLGRHADGFADVMVEGPPMRWLIDEGYLCDYDVACPVLLATDEKPRGSDGEYTHAQQRAAEQKRQITGDIATHYLKLAPDKSGITFRGTIEAAIETVAAYRAAGVTAELITGDTDPGARDDIFERAERGELAQIVAVDVISEGVDIPALQVGTLCRLTGSIITWRQQIGRLLRPIYAPGYDLTTRAGRLAAIAASLKPRALLIDHVGGFIDPLLGPPDKPRIWSLDRREARGKSEVDPDDIPRRICANPDVDCFKPYPRTLRACPYCGYEPMPAARSMPEHVDGDLGWLDPEVLAALQGRVVDVHKDRSVFEAEQLAKGAQSTWLNRHWSAFTETSQAQIALRDSMDRIAGQWHAEGLTDSEIQRRFFLGYGCDVLTAQGLSARDAIALKERIDGTVNSA